MSSNIEGENCGEANQCDVQFQILQCSNKNIRTCDLKSNKNFQVKSSKLESSEPLSGPADFKWVSEKMPIKFNLNYFECVMAQDNSLLCKIPKNLNLTLTKK